MADLFDPELIFSITPRSRGALEMLEQLLTDNLIHDLPAPWSYLQRADSQWVACPEGTDALGRWIDGDLAGWALTRELTCCDRVERLELGMQDGSGKRTLRLWACVDTRRQFRLFGLLCEALGVREACFIPDEIGGRTGRRWMVNAALSRDYALMSRSGFDMGQVRALAARLPHMRDYKPEGVGGEPARLGWLNYWSAPVARLLCFPNTALDAELMPRSVEGDDGSWYFALTRQALDVCLPDHVDALARAYERFDTIGRRYTAAEIAAKKDAKAARRRAKAAAKVEQDRHDASLPRFQIRLIAHPTATWVYQPAPLPARSPEDALKIFFARATMGRRPKLRESLQALAAKYDEMAETTQEPRSALLEAVLWQTFANAPAAHQAPPARELARTAVELYDMLATEAEDLDDLHDQIAAGLVEFGVDPFVAEHATALIDAALQTVHAGGELPSAELMRDPIFVALLEAAKDERGGAESA